MRNLVIVLLPLILSTAAYPTMAQETTVLESQIQGGTGQGATGQEAVVPGSDRHGEGEQRAAPFHIGTQAVMFTEQDQTRMYVRRWRPFDVPTMAVQEGFALVGYSVVFAALLPLTNTGSGLDDLGGSIITTHMLASLIGAPIGVQLGGGIMRGNGTFLGSLAGGAAGGLLGVLTMYITGNSTSTWIVYGTWLAASTLPSVVGYHLTASPVQRYFPVDEAHLALDRLDPVTPRADVQFTVLRVAF
jgi:hypothetical protein